MSANSKAGSDPQPPNLGGTKRGSFGSKLGIVLATAGSAVGLGNVWRFPYMTGENGGAAFILVYIVCILLLGIPGMIGEFVVGRYAQTNAARAYDILSRGKPWKLVGYLGILTGTIILGFYAVVAGWCLEYLLASIAGQLQGDAEAVKNYFVSFSSNPIKPVIWGVAFILVTHVVVIFGVRKGIERASKWLMPILLILLLILVVASCLLPNAMEGVRFLFEPDFSKVNRRVFLDVLLPVVGYGVPLHLCQLFFEDDQSAAFSRTDSAARHRDSHPFGLDDIPCGFFGGGESGQRTVAHLHHPAQCVPTGLWRISVCGISDQRYVLCPAGICGPDINYFHA